MSEIDSLMREFLDLPDEVIKWYEQIMYKAYYAKGLPYDFPTHWRSLGEVKQRQLIATLLEEAFPDRPCPRVTFSKRAAPLRTPSLSKHDCVPVPSSGDETEKVKHILLTWQNVRLVGMRGSGKTSKARWICKSRIPKGEKVYWVNPHLEYADKVLLESLGVTIVGGGRDYEAIADFCNRYCEGDNSILTKEYERYNSEPNAKFKAETIVLDELTNYKDKVGEPILTFVRASVQEFSKINRSTIYITHNTTLSCMGAPDGFAQAIKDNLFDLKLEADPMQGNRVPKAIAKYRMPNSDNWNDVTIPVEWQ